MATQQCVPCSLFLIVSTMAVSAATNQTVTPAAINNAFALSSNQSDIQCDSMYTLQTLSDTQIGYKLVIDASTDSPAVITVCPLSAIDNENSTETYIYLIKQVGSQYDLVSHIESVAVEDTDACNGSPNGARLDLTPLLEQRQYGTYFVHVENGVDGSFSLNMSCGAAAKLNDVTILIIVLSVVFLCVSVFCIFYYLQIKRVQSLQTVKPVNSDEHSISNEDDEDEQVVVEVYDDGEIIVSPHVQRSGGTETVEPAALNAPTTDVDLHDHDIFMDEDPIISVMNSAIESIKDGELDIYQVLAFRKNNRRSRRMKVKRPLSKFQINLNLLYLSSYQRTCYVAMTVFSLQVIGITVILYSVTIANKAQFACYWDVHEWIDHNNWIYKLLAFLWASVITINISINQKRIRDSALYKIIDQVPNKMYWLLDFVDIVLLHTGLLANLYTLFVAAIGSFFIVKSSSGGAESLDMVLNAVALFFMLDLDNMLVTNHDYRDVEDGCRAYLEEYLREKRESLHLPQMESRHRFESNEPLPRGQLCGIKGMSRMTKCVELFGYSIAGLTMILGFIAPIWILICYSAF